MCFFFIDFNRQVSLTSDKKEGVGYFAQNVRCLILCFYIFDAPVTGDQYLWHGPLSLTHSMDVSQNTSSVNLVEIWFLIFHFETFISWRWRLFSGLHLVFLQEMSPWDKSCATSSRRHRGRTCRWSGWRNPRTAAAHCPLPAPGSRSRNQHISASSSCGLMWTLREGGECFCVIATIFNFMRK